MQIILNPIKVYESIIIIKFYKRNEMLQHIIEWGALIILIEQVPHFLICSFSKKKKKKQHKVLFTTECVYAS